MFLKIITINYLEYIATFIQHLFWTRWIDKK